MTSDIPAPRHSRGTERAGAGSTLVELVDRYAVNEGETTYPAQGIKFFRYHEPVPPAWSELDTLSYCFLAQGSHRVYDGVSERSYDPVSYTVLGPHSRIEVEILTAAPENPYLSCAVRIDPVVVNEYLERIRDAPPGSIRNYADTWPDTTPVEGLDEKILDATRRLLETLKSPQDRTILLPVYVREIIYLLLRSPHRHTLLTSSRVISRSDPVDSGIRYMKAHLRESPSVTAIASAVCMSESSFAHLFKSAVGTSPYRYLKNLRLEQARDLLIESGASVSEAACQVGYSSLSHFIAEFKRHFGTTPRQYSNRLRGVPGLVDLRSSTVRTSD